MEKRYIVSFLVISLFLVVSVLLMGPSFAGTGNGIREVLTIINAPAATLTSGTQTISATTSPFCYDRYDGLVQADGKYFINYYKRGICDDRSTGSYADYCTSSTTLREYYCNHPPNLQPNVAGNHCYSTTKTCDYGCANGVCKSAPICPAGDCSAKIVTAANPYIGQVIRRNDGSVSSTCAHFVSHVLYDVGFPITVGQYDSVSGLVAKLTKECSQKIPKSSLKPGDIINTQGGTHIIIFTHFESDGRVSGIGSPGDGRPVQEQNYLTFSAGYRVKKCR